MAINYTTANQFITICFNQLISYSDQTRGRAMGHIGHLSNNNYNEIRFMESNMKYLDNVIE